MDGGLGQAQPPLAPENAGKLLHEVKKQRRHKPLRRDGEIVGVLAVFRLLPHKGSLDAIDIDLFDVLAAHAASALLFTRLYAASDGMVGANA